MSLLGALLTGAARVEVLPEAIETCATNHLLDIVGVALAAADTSAGAPWRRYADALPRVEGGSSVLGTGRRADPAEAALVNGSLMHSLEYDDTHTGAIAHGSAVLAATALAVGEAEGRSGSDVLRAYAVWYEVLIRLGLSAAGGFQSRGFQLTSVGGALCAAGLAASLRGLDRERQAAAVGIALSQASGVFAFLSNGATVKAMHPGWAAHAGIKAAALAEAGLTGPDRPFDDTFGLFRVFAGDAEAGDRFGRHLADLGTHWHLPDVAYKFLPCCHYIHPFVEAARRLAQDGLAPDRIAEMRFGVPAGAAPIICEPWAEKVRAEGHAARWSLPVVTAMQLCAGKVDLDSFEGRAGAGVHALAARASWQPLEDSRFPDRFDAALELELVDGARRELRLDDVYGNASRPPTEGDILAKFETNARRLLDPAAVSALSAALRGLAGRPDLVDMAAALRRVSPKEART